MGSPNEARKSLRKARRAAKISMKLLRWKDVLIQKSRFMAL